MQLHKSGKIVTDLKKGTCLSLCQDHDTQISCKWEPTERELVIKDLTRHHLLQRAYVFETDWLDWTFGYARFCDKVKRAFRDLKPTTVEVLVFFFMVRVKGSVVEYIECQWKSGQQRKDEGENVLKSRCGRWRSSRRGEGGEREGRGIDGWRTRLSVQTRQMRSVDQPVDLPYVLEMAESKTHSAASESPAKASWAIQSMSFFRTVRVSGVNDAGKVRGMMSEGVSGIERTWSVDTIIDGSSKSQYNLGIGESEKRTITEWTWSLLICGKISDKSADVRHLDTLSQMRVIDLVPCQWLPLETLDRRTLTWSPVWWAPGMGYLWGRRGVWRQGMLWEEGHQGDSPGTETTQRTVRWQREPSRAW